MLDSHDSIAKTKPQRQSKPNSKYESPDIILLAIKGRIRKKIKCEPIDQESDDNANANKPLSKQIIIKQEPKDYSEISNNNQYDSEIHHNFVMNQYSKRTIRQPKYLDDTVPDGRNVRGRSIRGRGIRGRRSRGSIGGRGRGGHTVRDVRDESHSSLEINISPVRSTARKSVASVYKGKSTRARGWPSTRGTRGGRGSRGSRGTRGIRGIRGIRGTRGGRGSRGSRTANSVRIKQEIDSLDEYLNEGNAINGKNCNCKAKHMRYFEMYKENLEATSREEIKNVIKDFDFNNLILIYYYFFSWKGNWL